MNLIEACKVVSRVFRRIVAIGCVGIGLAGCGDAKVAYGSIKDAQASLDGSALYVALESGDRFTEGNLFSGHTAERATALTLYRFDRATGSLTTVQTRKPSGDYRAGQSTLSVADLLTEGSTRPLVRCTALLSECSETAAVDAFVAGDAIAVPRSRTLLVVQFGRLSRVTMPLGGPEEFRIAADQRTRRVLATLKAEADAALRTMRAKDDGAPHEVEEHGSGTLYGEVPPIVASWLLVPGGTIVAGFTTGSRRSMVAWDANGRCVTDDPRVMRALPACGRAEIDSRGGVGPAGIVDGVTGQRRTAP